MTDGSICILDSYEQLFAKALNIEGKDNWHDGDSNPAAKLSGYYAKLLPPVCYTSVLHSSVFSSIGYGGCW